jgi:hypothetical protein
MSLQYPTDANGSPVEVEEVWPTPSWVMEALEKALRNYGPIPPGKLRQGCVFTTETFNCDACGDAKWERILGRDNDEIVIPCSVCQE